MTDIDREWYLRRKDGEGSVGPYSTEQLTEQWQKGLLDENAEGWKEGMPDWRPLSDIEPFALLVRVAPETPDVVRFTCECGNQIVMSDKFIGRLAKCQACDRTVTVYDPADAPEPEVTRKMAKPKRAGLPGWLIPASVVAGLVIVGTVIIYFVVGGSGDGDAVADDGGRPKSRIAQARHDVLADNPLGSDDLDTPPRDNSVARGNATEDRSIAADNPAPATDSPTNAHDKQPQPSKPKEDVSNTPDDKPEEATPEPKVAPIPREVSDLMEEFAKAYKTESATPIERVGEILVDDCALVLADGGVALGKQAVLEAIKDSISLKHVEHRKLSASFKPRWSRVVGDFVVLCGEWVEQGTLKQRARPSKKTFWKTLVLQLIDDQWRIVQIHTTPTKRKTAAAG